MYNTEREVMPGLGGRAASVSVKYSRTAAALRASTMHTYHKRRSRGAQHLGQTRQPTEGSAST
ncbi:hypothetical protein E2C01_015384 [Portunus trituberculatus]|uniref:Uncharacterized protein n=1 Tax=Portunus trituberculatus TaxID=210409 RepID=A0A5B7DLH6_PORTR|nr:hypothetical protein [Portunus trituberculatus]